ncbi:MAG: HEAT repeat domain-containing protein [Ktedonobacteraceae bacterium]
MSGESVNQEAGRGAPSLQQPQQREQLLAAIALLLGPDTDHAKRMRASQCLIEAGPEILPLLLNTLQAAPEIATPPWPWWPPQYEQISRLLVQLSQCAHLSLEELLHDARLARLPGPVLWTSVIEAVGLLPHTEHEALLREALQAPWWTVRYAATMAIANRATHFTLCSDIREALYQLQYCDSELPVRLVASCALLRCGESSGLELLMQILQTAVPLEIRKAALFILATELPTSLTPEQKHRLNILLIQALQDENHQSALHAARALRSLATPSTLPELERLLRDARMHTRLATLVALEELASRKTMRYAIQQQHITQQIASLLRASEQAIRHQACSTLAALGGEYANATIGTILLDVLHPAYLEAIEALRLLPEVLHPPVLARVMRWLLHALDQLPEAAQVCALDSLSYLLWQAHIQHRHTAQHIITQALAESGSIFQLLTSASAWVRQRTIELFSLLDTQLDEQRPWLLEMLHHDNDSGVRACIAYTLGQASALWAMPDLLLALLDCDEHVAETALNALGALPLHDDTLIISALKELAAYQLPIWSLQERRHLAHTARIWLKKRYNL